MDEIVSRIMDPEQWPDLLFPENLELLNEIADQCFFENSFSGMLAATMMYQQIIEAMCCHLIENCHFEIKLALYPSTISFKEESKKMLGNYLKELESSINFYKKDLFLEKVKNFNVFRNKIVHEMRKSNIDDLTRELTDVKKSFDEIFDLYDEIQDDFRANFHSIAKDEFIDFVDEEIIENQLSSQIDLTTITPDSKKWKKLEKGLEDYSFIMDNWKSDSPEFRRVYYNFYLKARRAVMGKEENREIYFQKLQNTNPKTSFMEVFHDMKNALPNHDNDISICSKLLHTLNPDSPIYDSIIRNYLIQAEGVQFWWRGIDSRPGKGAPRGTTIDQKIEHDYNALLNWYDNFRENDPRKDEWINWFDKNFTKYKNISEVKKIDFIIWACS